MLIAFYVLLGVLLLLALFFALLHPLLCIVDCALSIEHKLGTKIAWIAATLTMGFFATFAYTFLGTKSKWLRKSTGYAFALSAVCAMMAFGISSTSPEVKALISEANSKATAAAQRTTQLGGTASQLASQLASQTPSGTASELAAGSDTEDGNTVAFDTQLENFKKQVQQLRAQKLGPSDLAGKAATNEDAIPAGQVVSTTPDLHSDEPELAQREVSEETIEAGVAELEGDSLERQAQETESVDGDQFAAAWGDVASILDEPIAALQPEPASDLPTSDLPAEPSTTAEWNAGLQSEGDGEQALGSEPRKSGYPLANSIPRAPVTRPAINEQARSQSKPDSRPFNRYRGTAEPLKLDFPTPPIRNRYIILPTK